MFSSNATQVSSAANYIEDVFSTYLYAGNGSTQTITNNIDLSTKGGLVWIKGRTDATDHSLEDTLRTVSIYAATSSSNTTAAQTAGDITGFTTSGFSLRDFTGATNSSGYNYVSWTLRKQPKFFDIQTWSGNGTNGRTVAHSLGSVPGCIIVKRTDASNGWAVYHRSMNASPQDYMMRLNATDAAFTTTPSRWNNTLPTSTEFTLSGNDEVNGSGATYVAYLFAHDAGGFGLTGADNVISCGSFTTDGSGNATISLGYEPQWVLWKKSDGPVDGYSSWTINDNMRGFTVDQGSQDLYPNSSSAESGTGAGFGCSPTSTGFKVIHQASKNYIYIAIRRGPMRVPTSGTSVFAPVLNTGTGANTNISSGSFAPDMLWNKTTDHAYGTETWDKLRGVRAVGLTTSNTGAEGLSPAGYDLVSFNNTGVTEGANSGSVMNISSWLYVNYMFGRAPSFMDVVCYTGTAPTAQNLTHNLQAVPELIIIKRRDAVGSWFTGSMFTSTTVTRAVLNVNNDQDLNSLYSGQSIWGGQPTSSVFSVGTGSGANASGGTYVAYLFATCAGVSKVGSYTGNGSTQTINCGFTGGARFVMVKATSTTGNWIVADSARGIVAGNDPALYLNSTAAEVTGLDWIDADNSGFVVNETATIAANTNGVSYIFLAIS